MNPWLGMGLVVGALAGLMSALPEDILERPMQILASPGVLHGLSGSATDAQRCARSACGPVVLIGMIDAAGECGRIGGGAVDVPVDIFHAALAGLLE